MPLYFILCFPLTFCLYICVASCTFFQILDEVEKRRGISPALVQPLMRSVMEAPFPALGRTITVKNFLPGSGTEVRITPEQEEDGMIGQASKPLLR